MLKNILLAGFVIGAIVGSRPVLGRTASQALTPAASKVSSSYPGGFYIISSVNLKNHELFLKTPTEVTELMLVNGQTEILNEAGGSISLADLRAGNTVYVVTQPQAASEPLATRIQIGPMTAQILRERYQKL